MADQRRAAYRATGPEGRAERAVCDHKQALHRARGSRAVSGAPGRHHHHHHHHHHHGPSGRADEIQAAGETAARSILPSAGSVVQAGAFGAALGGMTTGVVEMARVRQGQISTEEAIRNVVKSSAQGAATMAVASVAGQLVRSHPVFSFIALAAAGIGAFSVLSGAGTERAVGAAPGDPADATTEAAGLGSRTSIHPSSLSATHKRG